LLPGLRSEEDGAVLIFLGTVRNHNDGREVTGLEYEAYREMGEKVLGAIAGEAAERFGTDRILVRHRVGRLKVGDVSTAIAVATPHRAEAYEASRYIIEEIKKRLPVWKKEHYTDEEPRWIRGHEPTGTHGRMRAN
ncbi:molybdenum cofactor biosynthesis protein MoaE, partial [Gemmatimonadota bacterium]